jgi:hypothetical protein
MTDPVYFLEVPDDGRHMENAAPNLPKEHNTLADARRHNQAVLRRWLADRARTQEA